MGSEWKILVGRANVGLLGRKVVGYFSEFISNDHFYRDHVGAILRGPWDTTVDLISG